MLKSLLHTFCLLALISSAELALGQEPPKQATSQPRAIDLPSAWLGTWQGEVTSQSAEGVSARFEMRLEIASLPEKDRLSWKIIYRGEQGESQRDYLLVADATTSGRFVIDEQNGIQIATTLLGNSLHSNFSTGGQTIWTRYEMIEGQPSVMQFELVTASDAQALTSGGDNDVPEVSSLVPATRQTGRLVRTETSQPAPGSKSTDLTAWKKLATEAYRGKQDDIYFVNDQVGWYGNGAGKIFKTTDGGQTWTQQLEQSGTYFRCLAFIDQQHGFAGNIGPGYFPNVTDKNPLYETKDGGQTWRAVDSIEGPPVVGLCALQVLKEEYINAGKLDQRIRLIGVGRVGGPTATIISDDLGATWQQIDISKQAAMAFDVHFLNRREGFIAAATDADVANSHASILYTNDGGQTWQNVYQSTRPYELTWKIAFPSPKVGYVTIQSYDPDPKVTERFVAKTVDGGKSWQEVPLVKNPAVRQFGIAFLDEKIGWVGAVPHGFMTEDGGATWNKVNFGNAVNKIRLLTTEDKTVGFAIGTEVHRLDLSPQPAALKQ